MSSVRIAPPPRPRKEFRGSQGRKGISPAQLWGAVTVTLCVSGDVLSLYPRWAVDHWISQIGDYEQTSMPGSERAL